MNALQWINRVLALLVALFVLAVVAPSLYVDCEPGGICGGWLNARSLHLLLYAAMAAIAVALVFFSRNRRRWFGVLGWGLLLAMAALVLQ